jgi:hypothetical protein
MSALETLTALLRGDQPTSGLLHNCRLEGCGHESYGVEAIVENFRSLPMADGTDQLIFQDTAHMAIFVADEALFADVIDGNVLRIWRLGSGDFLQPESGISVSFDPNLSQAGQALCFDPKLHPALSSDAAEKLTEIGLRLAQNDDAYRACVFVLRAFGNAERGAALFAIYRLTHGDVRASGFAHAAFAWGASETHVVHDIAAQNAFSEQPWTPRIPA